MSSKGFSLVELMVVVALVASLALCGTFVFARYIEMQIDAVANDYLNGIRSARELALVRGGKFCWIQRGEIERHGWEVVGKDGNAVVVSYRKAGIGYIFRSTRTLSDGVCFDGSGVALLRNGAFQAGSIYLCNHQGSGVRITVNRGGRVRRSMGVMEQVGCGIH